MAGQQGSTDKDSSRAGGNQQPSRAVGSPISATPDEGNHVEVSTENYKTRGCAGHLSSIWAADALARRMLDKVRRTLGEDPPRKELKPLFLEYFMTPTPNVLHIKSIYARLIGAFNAGGYSWKCVTNCAADENGRTNILGGGIGAYGPMELCMSRLSKYPIDGTAKTMIHEMGHWALELEDVLMSDGNLAYCSVDPSDPGGCPGRLTAEDALKNADSYACFAVRVWKLMD